MNARSLALVAVVPAVLAAAGCGASKSASPSTPSTTRQATQQTTTAASGSPGALQGEAAAAATGDIPDNQVFLVHHSTSGWSMKYPEGWAQSGGPNAAVIRDKNNIVRVVVKHGSAPTSATVRTDRALRHAHVTSGPKVATVGRQRAIKVVYTTESPPNPVTGKRVTLTVDRYYLVHAGRVATIDLGTPIGVDNVDAYRLMIGSFRWK